MTLEINGDIIPYAIKTQTDRNNVTRQYYRATVIVSRDPVSGREKKKEFTAPTVEKLRNKILSVYRFRALSDGSVLSLRDYLENWMEKNRFYYKPTTYDSYQYFIHHYIFPRIGSVRMADLSESILNSFFRQIILEYGARTARNAKVCLKRPLEEAAERFLTPGSPMSHIHIPRCQPKAIIPLSRDECQRLLILCQNDVYGGAVALSLLLGLRIGEVLGISLDSIDLSHRRIHIRRQISTISKGKIIQNCTKNNLERVLYLNDPSVAWIQRELNLLSQKQQISGINWKNEHNFLFTTVTGSFLSPATLRNHFKPLIQQLGLPNFKFHHLRHTAATIVHEQTNNLQVTKELLGHKLYESTGIYIHSSEEKLMEASLAIARYISPQSNAP